MVRFFNRGEGTSDMNPGVTRWGRVALVGLGVLIVGGLIVGTFLYGSQQRGEDEPEQQQEQAVQAPQENPAATQGGQGSQPAPGEQGNADQGTNPQTSSGQPAPQTSPTAGPTASTTPTTGPEDWAPFIATAITLLLWYARQSKTRLSQAQRNL